MGARLVQSLIDNAAFQMGDPNKERVRSEHWLTLYNLAARAMCGRFKMLKATWQDDLDVNHFFTYPDDITVLTGVRVSETPDDLTSWRWLREMRNRDTFRMATDMKWPDEQPPRYYWPDPEVVYLIGKPTITVTNGLIVEGFALPLEVVTAQNALYEPFDNTADLCTTLMLIYARYINKQAAEASDDFKLWAEQASRMEDQIEDRADDLRQSIDPPMEGRMGQW